jgi:hypothetical protein
MAEDIRIRLLVDGEEVVGVVQNADEAVEELTQSGQQAEEQVESWAKKYRSLGEAQEEVFNDLVKMTGRGTKSLSTMEAGMVDLERRASLTADELQNASIQAQRMDDSMRRAGGAGTEAAQALSGIAADAPFGVIGVANNFEQLTAAAARADGGLRGLASNLMSFGNIATIAVGAISGLAAAYGDDLFNALFSASEQTTELTDRMKELKGVTEGVLSIEQEEPQFEIGSIEDAERSLDQLRTRRDLREESLQKARELQRLRENVSARDRRLAQQDPSDFSDGDMQARILEAREEVQRLNELEEQFGDDRDLQAFIDRSERRMEVLRGQVAALEDLIQAEEDLQAQRNLGDLQGVDRVTDDEGDGEPTDIDSQAPPVEPTSVQNRIIPQEMPDLNQQLVLFQELRTELDRINRKPFLKEADKADQRVQAVVQRIRELQAVGAALDREVINGIIESLELTEEEANDVREALSGIEEPKKKKVEDQTAGAFQRGFQSGFQGAIQQELQPMLEQIESDFARALISAMAQAAASEAAQRLTDQVFSEVGGGSSSPQQAASSASGAASAGSGGGGLSSQIAGGIGALGWGVALGQGVQNATGSRAAGALAGGATAALLAASLGFPPLAIAGLGAAGLIGGAFEDGGRPPVGKVSLVGENGPEAFVPDQPGTIVPNADLQAAIETPDQSGLIKEVRKLREATEAALNRPAKAEFTPREFRRGREGTEKFERSKSPRRRRN